MVEGSAGTESHDSELVGTTCLRLCRVADSRIVLENAVLNGCALVVDELEDAVGRHLRQLVGLGGIHVAGLQRHILIVAHELEVEVSSCPARLVHIVLILPDLVAIVDIELILTPVDVAETVEDGVAVADAVPGVLPVLVEVIGRSPGTVVEVLNGVAGM